MNIDQLLNCQLGRCNLDLSKLLPNEYLTPRELDVLKLLILGYTAKKMAQNLGISDSPHLALSKF